MGKYWWFIKTSIEASFIDRADILLYSLSLFTTPVIVMAVWLVISVGGANTPMSYKELAIYFLANVLIKTITSSWIGQFIPGRIRRGEISLLLLKPVPILTSWITNNIAEKLIKIALLTPAVIIIGYWLAVEFPSLKMGVWLLVILTTLIAGTIYFLLDVTVGFLAFWLDETRWIQDAFSILESFFSGRVIPLVLFPLFWQEVAALLPFRYMLSLPLEILLGQLNNAQLSQAVGIQIGYLVLVVVLYKITFHFGIRRYGASGA